MYDDPAALFPTLRTVWSRTEEPRWALPSTQVGQVLAGRYELIERLGGGGMGEVFKALDRLADAQEDPDPYVAVKILRPELQQDQTAVKALQREANRALRLTHTNIVRVRQLEQDQVTGTQFIVMELLEGETVQSLIARNRKGQTWAQIAGFVEQICSGLAYAHREGIVHCDIKPSNLFITRRGVVKILDFGIAAPMPGAADGRRETRVDARKLGAHTPEYASLELSLGQAAHYSDDVYSLACVIHEWLSGSHPYLSRTLPSRPLTASEVLASGTRPAPLRGLKRTQRKALRKAMNPVRAARTSRIDTLWRSLSVRPRRSRGLGAALLTGVLALGGALLADAGLELPLTPPLPVPIIQSLVTAGPVQGTVTERPAEAGKPAEDAAVPYTRAAGENGLEDETQGMLRAAREGDARSQYALGLLYQTGRGVPPNPGTAARWFARAAAQGHAQAQVRLGLLYLSGRGVPRSYFEGVRWLRSAADQGNADAQARLGYLYATGQGGLVRDEPEAARWLLRAAAQGHANGQYNLAVMIENGRGGLPRSEAQVQQLLVLAARQGNADARSSLLARGQHW